ncbi:exopolyphosphatase [Mycolicibacterium chitae]|uniref:NUDIX hydrolase n=1 Tax=Mycolicibacterium chitae TaxID=1792 RepID=A0A448I7K1_MYCCI|nr:NUDIX domain-containing protein [Mycolicibacterium chitae]MCV7104198.1 NUDIX domain-containing protein [Mycolicibacterium chitae]BBZ04867.1 exopolyphosphatase [Mycolicibacterium chitae]VEG48491.1 NUDIX hydrolase [Mycolicibacterium chitae]
MTLWLVLAVVVAVLAVALIGGWAYQTANRLDRLHVRYDLSWQVLDAALGRRAVVARAVAGSASDTVGDSTRLVALADAAERAPRSTREAAENELSAALAAVDIARLPTALVAELADVEARVLLARRFHNDAVRDTLALRERPVVRLLRLGGHAPLPGYFEIAERAEIGPPAGEATVRSSARVVLLDEGGSVLLLCGVDPAITDGSARRFWFTIGGQARPGERLVQAAVRELTEETGLRVPPAEMVGPVWRRDAMIDFNGAVVRSQEYFFVHRTRRFEPSTAGRTDLEHRYILGHRWCDAAHIAELVAAGESVYPTQLGELLASANDVARTGAHSGAADTEPAEHRLRAIH